MADPFFDGQRRGGPADVAPTPDAGPAPVPQAAPGGWGSHMPEGYDLGKVGSGHASPKYQIGQIMSRYDPSQGISDAMMEELNKTGLATFNRLDGDKVGLSGNIDPRFKGVTNIDLIRNFTGEGDKAWWFGADAAGGPAGGGSPSLNVRALQALMGGAGGATTPGQRAADLPGVEPPPGMADPSSFAPVQMSPERQALDAMMGTKRSGR